MKREKRLEEKKTRRIKTKKLIEWEKGAKKLMETKPKIGRTRTLHPEACLSSLGLD